MNRFFNFLLTQRFFVFLLTAILVIVGLVSWNRLPIDAFPDVTNVQVMILTKVPGLTSLDVEQRVTFPIEQHMGGLPRVKQVRSVSKSEISQVVIIFEDDVDIYFARQLVFERLAEAKESLPPDSSPEMTPITTGLGEVFQYTLDSDELSPTELRTLQDWVVAPQLRTIPGVTEINSFGGFVKQYHVIVDPAALEKYGISLRLVIEKLEENNANAGGSFIVKDWQQTFIRSLGLLTSMEDIGNVVLKDNNGTPILVKDVASISIGAQTRQGGVTRDDQGEVVAGMVIMLQNANSKTVVESVKSKIPQIQKALPKNVRLNPFYDRTSLIQACIKTVIDAITEGGICVIFILFLFLAELRTAFVVLFSIPLTFLVSFIIMDLAGMSSNLMSLGGLAFSVGMVVDATIVVTENARRHLSLAKPGETRMAIVSKAIQEVVRPVSFSIFIVSLILIPLFTLQGMEGKMFIPLAQTMLIALLASLGIALLIVPALGESLLPMGKEYEFPFVSWFHRMYGYTLNICLKYAWTTIAISLLLLIGTGSLATRLGTDFMPDLDEGAIAINSVRLPNASLAGSVKVADEIGRMLKVVPEIETVVGKTGRAEISEDPMGPEQTDFVIMLKSRHDFPQGRSKAEVTEHIRQVLSQVPGLRHSFSQPIALRVNELISGIKSDVAVKIFGDDLDLLAKYAVEVSAILAATPGSSDSKSAQLSGMQQLDIQFDRATAARYGLNAADVNELIETAVGGKVATTIIEGQRRFDLQIRYPENIRKNQEDIMNLRIRTPGDQLIPLRQIATIKQVEIPIEVKRENGLRSLVVEANVRNRDLGSFVSDLQKRLEPLEAKLPTGYFLSIGGQFENQQRAMSRLALVVPVVLLFILILLVMALGKLRDALLVIAILPFALVGGIIALWLWNMTFSVSAAVAFIVLLGVAVQDGVLLISFMRQLIEEGKALPVAIRQACALRYRAIMMTTLTSFIGHVPMLLSNGSGADIQQPLALVVNGGLISSTLLTLYVVPVIFGLLEKRYAVLDEQDIKEPAVEKV
ncbi:MAG: CzcABC family efflux RND transporter, transmembrane protein [Candidatus Rifleibacterium amylolyticum]|nr:MAG: CzcABC family efflux RND transporter, transmembrane protein [Candidatus Rifleibacterium amylolyticum]NLF97198.1 efflux RND transporter permease subunit [Candidatus Riflebacteria bacterium]